MGDGSDPGLTLSWRKLKASDLGVAGATSSHHGTPGEETQGYSEVMDVSTTRILDC